MRVSFFLIIGALIVAFGLKGWRKFQDRDKPADEVSLHDNSPVIPATPSAEPDKAPKEDETEKLREKLATLEATLSQVRDAKLAEAQIETEKERARQEAARIAAESKKQAEAGFVAHVFKNREVPTREELGSLLPGEFFADTSTNQIIAAVKTLDESVDVAEVLRGLDQSPERSLYRVEAVLVTAELLDADEFSLEWLAKFTNQGQPWKASGEIGSGTVQFRSDWFDLSLSRARDLGKLDILSRPHLVLSRGESATVSSGREVPLPSLNVSDGTSQSGIEYRRVALETTVTLDEIGDGRVALAIQQVNAQVSSTVPVGEIEAPEIASQEWKTRILPEFGQWFAVGGVTVERIETTKRLGFFTARKKAKSNQRLEIGMFVRVLPATVSAPPVSRPSLRAVPVHK